MKKRTKEKLKSVLYPILQLATLGQISTVWTEKIWKWYVNFLDFFFTLTTSITITTTFAWFIPIYLNRGYELSIVIVLCLILLQLRYGTMTTEYKEEDE